jgi:hypothetical protein
LAAITRFAFAEVYLSMNILANTPAPGLEPIVSVHPSVANIAATAMPKISETTMHQVKDTLVAIYAYGLLAFGMFFPVVLVAWKLMTGPVPT